MTRWAGSRRPLLELSDLQIGLLSSRAISAASRPRCWIVLAILLSFLPGCASNSYLSVRRVPQNPLAGPLDLLSRSGPKPTDRTRQLLRRYDLVDTLKRDPKTVLHKLEEQIAAEPTIDATHAYAELTYIQAKKAQVLGRESEALDLYSAAVAHAYLYLFSPQFEYQRNAYDPQFRRACDVYNASLEEVLRIMKKQGRLSPGQTYAIAAEDQHLDVQVVACGLWKPDDFKEFEFVSDYEVKGLVNRHVTYGLGVPLIAIHRGESSQDPASRFYPRGMSFPVTAILRAVEKPCLVRGGARRIGCALELHDPLVYDQVPIAGRLVPLETDLTTPIGFQLEKREFSGMDLANLGLRDPSAANKFRGLYMLEAFDPRKIPVVLVHGLWSSPDTWTEMLNDLRSLPEIRNGYQFWAYAYPTGQPFWYSATQMRDDLQTVRRTVDADRRWPALDRMVLVGHSMGGLVSRLQTLPGGEPYWRMLTDRPLDELQADPETREQIVKTLFFQPNPDIRRVITIGTPHRGSDFVNDYTRWLGRKLITLPAMMTQTKAKVLRDNPDFFRNTDLFTVNTSIDSLSPDSPLLPVMLASEKPPWVSYHNIVGVVSERDLLGRITEKGDGAVTYESAHLDDVQSEIVVEADHVHVHQHPRAILEVRRILLEHSEAMFAEMSGPTAIPAGYPARSELPPVDPRWPSPTEFRIYDQPASAETMY
jgi:pimeloyl-ACP methyl ester carboxylesterase